MSSELLNESKEQMSEAEILLAVRSDGAKPDGVPDSLDAESTEESKA